jgi:hypothetical protein
LYNVLNTVGLAVLASCFGKKETLVLRDQFCQTV